MPSLPRLLLLTLLSAPAAIAADAPAAPREATAIFAAGCFWCVEAAYEDVPGVRAVVSGYTGGTEPNPTYELVSSGRTGHVEAVQVTYDPARITYEELLAIFWRNVDPVSADGQFCDRGDQYRASIFTGDEAQRVAAEASKRAVEARLGMPVVTTVLPATAFHPAEAYHQDFAKTQVERYRRYRAVCGRDRRLREVWGEAAATPKPKP